MYILKYLSTPKHNDMFNYVDLYAITSIACPSFSLVI